MQRNYYDEAARPVPKDGQLDDVDDDDDVAPNYRYDLLYDWCCGVPYEYD